MRKSKKTAKTQPMTNTQASMKIQQVVRDFLEQNATGGTFPRWAMMEIIGELDFHKQWLLTQMVEQGIQKRLDEVAGIKTNEVEKS